MNRQDFAEYMERTYREKTQSLRAAGQQEYAHDEGDAFANFKRVGVALSIPQEQILLVYLQKHIDGIFAWARGHRSQRESVQGRIDDSIVYLYLLRAMVDEMEGKALPAQPAPASPSPEKPKLDRLSTDNPWSARADKP